MSRIASGIPRQCTIALLSNGDRFRTVWSTSVDGLRLEKCLDQWEPIWENRKVHWIRAVAARTRGSVIPFDTFDRRLRRRFNMMDRLVRAAADVAVPQVVDRRDADAALASSRVKAEIIRQCLSSTGITPRPFKDTIRMFVSVKLFLASNSFYERLILTYHPGGVLRPS